MQIDLVSTWYNTKVYYVLTLSGMPLFVMVAIADVEVVVMTHNL